MLAASIDSQLVVRTPSEISELSISLIKQPDIQSIKLVHSDEDISVALVENFDKNFVDRVAEPVTEGSGVLCDVCYEEFAEDDFFALKCGHSFCVNCQADLLRTKITNG